jgi:hypothetical protein
MEETKFNSTLDELMAQCDLTAELSDEDKLWFADKPQGREEI